MLATLKQLRSLSTFRACDLQVKLTQSPITKPPFDNSLKFGRSKTDHLLEVDYIDKQGWNAPVISPYHNLSIDPRSSALHYGVQCFEGMKAYKDARGRTLLFRPDMNMLRLYTSAISLALPVNCI